MSKNSKSILFENQDFFIGIDVHKNSWTITIRSSKMELKTFTMPPDPRSLKLFLSNSYPRGNYYSVYEAGFCGFWIDRELKKLNIENIVINAPDVPTTNKEKLTKTDKIDSRKLARELENKTLHPLYIPPNDIDELRSLCRLRHSISKEITRIKNRIKSYLYLRGYHFYNNIEVNHWSSRFIDSIKKLDCSITSKNYLAISLKSLEQKREELTSVTKLLRKFCSSNPKNSALIKNLLSIPGIGFITAVTLYSEIIDINRFNSLDKLCSYIGLVPSSHSSGEKDITSRITTRKKNILKYMIIEASWIAVRKDPAMLKVFTELSNRMVKSKAIIKISKKLLNRVRFVWKNNKQYNLVVA